MKRRDLHRDGLTLAVVAHDEAVSRRAARQVRTIDGSVGRAREAA